MMKALDSPAQKPKFRFGPVFVLTLFGWVISVASQSFGQDEKIDFAHQIVPVLKKHCAKCHSNGTYKGGMSIDSRAALLKTGTIEVGNSRASDLIERITSSDEDVRMPPDGDRLSADEIAIMKKWIDGGLNWESGFTFKKATWKSPIRPRKPVIPATSLNPLDYLVDRYFAKKEIKWPANVDDATFLRRSSMDLVGLLPSRSELSEFLEDKSPGKRKKWINKLLARNRDYADHWLTFWNDHLRNDYVGTGYIDGGRKQITNWLYRSLYENKSYDQFARELIAPGPDSEGFIKGIKWRGNVNASQVRELQFAQNISQVFLGENLKCASCHDSFINDWKLEDAYGLAAILSDKPLEMYRCDKPTGETMNPKFLWPELGKIDRSANQTARLQQTAQLITGKDNGRFTRTIVNRIWKRMMGRGLVEPVDIMGNRPWDEDILDFLAVHLQENEYDLKKTMALIANSKIYQSESQPLDEVPDSEFVFNGPIIRRMTAEQFMDSVMHVTGGEPRGQKGPVPVLPQTTNAKELSQPAAKLKSKWIWRIADAHTAAGGDEVEFTTTLSVDSRPKNCSIVMTCDNEYTLFVNGKKVRNDKDWNSVELISVARLLKPGKNSIRIIGKNHTNSPNPAGLYVSVFVDRKPANIQWKVPTGEREAPAQAVTHQQIWDGAKPGIVAKEMEAMSERTPIAGYSRPKLRMSHFVSNSLMRSLGRPNREQIVTTRDDQLSTLQALDLSNGQIFADILGGGSTRRLSQLGSSEKIIRHVYEVALSRQPTPEEFKVLVEIVGEKPDSQSIADLIWTVVMLPEFQNVR